MTASSDALSLEEQIGQWRTYLNRWQGIDTADVAKLEARLREEIVALAGAGLTIDEAFLVAVMRLSDIDRRSRDFAREHSDRLWKQRVVSSSDKGALRTDAIIAFCVAVAAAVTIKIPALFGLHLDTAPGF